MPRPRVVMLGTSPDGRGGIATVLSHYREIGLFRDYPVELLVTHVQASRVVKLRVMLRSCWRLLSLLLAGHVVLGHVHMSSRASTWRKSLYVLALRVFRVPYVIHLHSGEFPEFYRRCVWPGRFLIDSIVRGAAQVLVLSEGWSRSLREIWPQRSTQVLHNTVPVPRQPAEPRAEEVPALLFLGRIDDKKGFFDLLQALGRVAEPYRLVVGGEGEIERAREVAASLGIAERICFAGWVTGAEKAGLLANSAVFVLPSHFEGVPMVILEAMAAGLPVVATRVGGIPEVVSSGEDGLLVPAEDIAALASALSGMLGNSALRQVMGARGRAKIEATFSHARLLPDLLSVWASLGVSLTGQKDGHE